MHLILSQINKLLRFFFFCNWFYETFYLFWGQMSYGSSKCMNTSEVKKQVSCIPFDHFPLKKSASASWRIFAFSQYLSIAACINCRWYQYITVIPSAPRSTEIYFLKLNWIFVNWLKLKFYCLKVSFIKMYGFYRCIRLNPLSISEAAMAVSDAMVASNKCTRH